MNYLTDQNDVLIPGLLAQLKDTQEIRTIETQMLDGSFSIQTIGRPSTQAEIDFYCSMQTRRSLQDILQAGSLIKAVWRGQTYAGYLSGKSIKWEKYWPNRSDRQEKLSLIMQIPEVL